MRETGQNGEFGHGPSRTIQTGVFPAAPEQSEKLYDVGGAGASASANMSIGGP